MSLAAGKSAHLPAGNTTAGQALGSHYIIRGLNFQYQTPGGAYYIGGDFSGKIGQASARYFQAC